MDHEKAALSLMVSVFDSRDFRARNKINKVTDWSRPGLVW